MTRRPAALSLLAAALLLAGCGDSTGAPPAPGHVYIANNGRHNVLVFQLPLTDVSVPTDTIAPDTSFAPFGIAVNAAGDLAVCTNGRWVQIFHPPITSASMPLFSVDTLLPPVFGIAVDAGGRLYAADNNDQRIFIFNTPLSASSAIADSVVSGLSSPFAITIGSDGRLYVANGGTVLSFAPPITHGSLPEAVVGSSTADLSGTTGIAVGK